MVPLAYAAVYYVTTVHRRQSMPQCCDAHHVPPGSKALRLLLMLPACVMLPRPRLMWTDVMTSRETVSGIQSNIAAVSVPARQRGQRTGQIVALDPPRQFQRLVPGQSTA